METDFVHLHTHSYFTLLQATASPEKLVERAVQLGQRAIALTDFNNMFGAVRFYRAARRAGIKPLIGMQLAVGSTGRPLTLLAETDTGYRNLVKLATAVRTEAPRRTVIGHDYRGDVGFQGSAYRDEGKVAKQLLFELGDGLIVLSGGRESELTALLRSGLRGEAYRFGQKLRDRFGRDNFFIELQNQRLPEQCCLNEALAELAQKLQVSVVATNDVRYLHKEEAPAHAALLAVGAGTTWHEPDRPTFGSPEFYFASGEEMARRFADLSLTGRKALANTVAIAERCTLSLGDGVLRLPDFGPDAALRLRDLAYDGARRRFGESLPDEVQARLQNELHVINGRGFASYFLAVADVIDEAKRRNIPVGPGRGSAAASLTAYCLGITAVNPLAHGLIFERFLNPERVRMPDIDIDVADTRRDELLACVRERFGKERVAQIVTFGTLAARAALREAGRIFATPKAKVDHIIRHVESGSTLADREQTATLARLALQDAEIGRIVRLAKAVEGVPRHVSVHAAGVVIGDGSIGETVPLLITRDGQRVTQYPMDDVEHLGFLKLDVLGLRTLSVIDNARTFISRQKAPSHAVATSSGQASLRDFIGEGAASKDAKVYRSLRTEGTAGLFQLETPMFQNLVGRLQPENFTDIVALLALGRPGPMQRVEQFMQRRRGQQPVEYIHKRLEPILKETYGIIVYQEQVMHIAMQVAGYSAAEADLLRRRLTERSRSVVQGERERFIAGAKANGLETSVANTIWDELIRFAGYGFAKSHSVAYSLLTLETARLRTHYPGPFWAALLTSVMGDENRLRRYIRAARRLGVRVVPPDVNKSGVDFEPIMSVQHQDAPEKAAPAGAKAIVSYGLAALRHVGRGGAEKIVQRRREGMYQSFADFCRRLPEAYKREQLLRSLIEAGAFDRFGQSRQQLLEELKRRNGSSGRSFVQTGSLFKTAKLTQLTHKSTASDMIEEKFSPFVLTVAPDYAGHLRQLKALLAQHPGPVPVIIKVPVDGRLVAMRVERKLWVDGSLTLLDTLRKWHNLGRLTAVKQPS